MMITHTYNISSAAAKIYEEINLSRLAISMAPEVRLLKFTTVDNNSIASSFQCVRVLIFVSCMFAP